MVSLSDLDIDMFELIKELESAWKFHPKFFEITKAFNEQKESGNNIQMCCPFHNENKPSFGIMTVYPYTFNCQSSNCGEKGSLPKLVQYVYQLDSYEEAVKQLRKIYFSDSALDLFKYFVNDVQEPKTEEELSSYLTEEYTYMRQRGFRKYTLEKYEVGFDNAVRAAVFPVRDIKGDIRFFKKRYVDYKRFDNEKHILKRDIVYGLYYIYKARGKVDTIYLNESETDTMACYQANLPAGAVLGSVLFKEQINVLMKTGIKTINLFFDNDQHGLKCALNAQDSLKKYPVKVNIVIYPGGMYGLDTLNKEEVTFGDANNLLKAGKLSEIKLWPIELFKIKCKKEIRNEFK